MIKFSRHPEKYDIELRFKKVQKLIRQVLLAFKVDFNSYNFDEYYKDIDEKKCHMLVANHISDLDPLILIALAKRPLTVVAKKQIASYPFVSKIIKTLDGEFLDRDDLKQSLKIFKKIGEKMSNSTTPDWLIFPEGTRNKVDPIDTKPFHYGTFKPAMKNYVSVYVFSLLGTQRVLSLKCKDKVYPVLVKFSGVFKAEDYKDLKTVDLSTQCYKLCKDGVASLAQEDKRLVILRNKKN